MCSWYLPSSLKLLVIKDLQTLPTTRFEKACRRGSRLQSRRHTETTLRHSIRKMSTLWKWKLVRDLKGCQMNFCSTTAVKDLENTSLTLKHGLCKYSLIFGLEGSVSNRKAWVKKWDYSRQEYNQVWDHLCKLDTYRSMGHTCRCW